jgi:hypothetical protein
MRVQGGPGRDSAERSEGTLDGPSGHDKVERGWTSDRGKGGPFFCW